MSDNCSVINGKKTYVLSRIKQKQPYVMDMGCIYHLANLCCDAAVKEFRLLIEEFIIDM